jgi:hypothetical protein
MGSTIQEQMRAVAAKFESQAQEEEAPGVDSGAAEPVATGGADESAADATDAQPESADEAPLDAASPSRNRAPDGKFAKAGDQQSGNESKAPAPKPGAKALVKPSPVAGKDATKPLAPGVPNAAQTPAPGATDAVKPPQSWKPLAREKWTALPPEVQQEVARREKEIAVALSESAPARKLHDDFRQVAQQYPHILAGQDPVKGFADYTQTIHNLRHGPPEQKLQLHEQIADAYGIPLDETYLARQFVRRGLSVDRLAQAIDAMSSGQPVQSRAAQMPTSQEDIVRLAEQRMMERLQAVQGQTLRQREEQERADFEASRPDFLDELRGEIDGVRKAGLAKDLKSAYNWALSRHRGDPDSEIGKVLRQREAAQQANAQQASTQRAKLAASSVKSQPTGAAAPQSKGIRETLEAAAAAKGLR